jgi:hypothetical protein
MDIFFFELLEKSLSRISYENTEILIDTRKKLFTSFFADIRRDGFEKKYKTILPSFTVRRYLLFYATPEKWENIGIFLFFSLFKWLFLYIFSIEFSRYTRLIGIILAKIRTMDTRDDFYDFSFIEKCTRLRKVDICRTFYSVDTISHIDGVEIFVKQFIFGIAYLSYACPECFTHFFS